jgi:iron complex transport system permease protein
MSKKRSVFFFTICILLAVFLFAMNIVMGSASVSVSEIVSILLGKGYGTNAAIILSIRLPRAVAAVALGGALALSGYLLQTFFGNPIVGPYVLGISSGAKLCVALTMIMCMSHGRSIGLFAMILSAFIGSMIAMAFVLAISVRVKGMGILVVCGIMIGYICSAITDFVVTFADDSNIVNLHNWSLGSFSGTTMEHVQISLVFVAGCLIVAFMLSKPIGAYQLGEAYARNMGVDIRALRILLILVSSLLSATVTAFAGPISFVGIAVPHIIRGLLKTAKPIIMIPACFIGGSIITIVCDDIARTAFAPTELSISSVTAIGLAPIVIYLLIRRDERSWKR